MADDDVTLFGKLKNKLIESKQKWADEGFDQLTFSPTTNTLPTDVIVASMELFGREVIPQFDKDPVHSTTRYREAAAAKLARG